jgi:hypothetical protein
MSRLSTMRVAQCRGQPSMRKSLRIRISSSSPTANFGSSFKVFTTFFLWIRGGTCGAPWVIALWP